MSSDRSKTRLDVADYVAETSYKTHTRAGNSTNKDFLKDIGLEWYTHVHPW